MEHLNSVIETAPLLARLDVPLLRRADAEPAIPPHQLATTPQQQLVAGRSSVGLTSKAQQTSARPGVAGGKVTSDAVAVPAGPIGAVPSTLAPGMAGVGGRNVSHSQVGTPPTVEQERRYPFGVCSSKHGPLRDSYPWHPPSGMCKRARRWGKRVTPIGR